MATFEGVSPAAMAAWESLMAKWGEPLGVTSAYRSPEHNRRVGGARHSQHMEGNAFDVNVAHLTQEQRLDLIRQAREAGFRGVGVYDNALHFDVGPTRAWGPSYRSDSIPEWARAAVGAPVGGGGPDAAQPPSFAQGRQPSPEEQYAALQNALVPFRPQAVELDPRAFMRERNALSLIPLGQGIYS